MKTVRTACIAVAGVCAAAFAGQAQATPEPPAPLPAPPVLVSPANSEASRQARQDERRKVAAFDIEVRGGREILWSGSLRVAGNASGEYTQSKREARQACSGESDISGIYSNRQNELRVSLSRRYGENETDGFVVTVNWVRPLETCFDGQGTRTVAIMQGISLAPGGMREIAADGGLIVRLTRRP